VTDTTSAERSRVLELLADDVVAAADRRPGRALRVGVTGVAGSGKTTLAAELATTLRRRGRTTFVVGGDDFHRPRSVRYRRGRESAEGYYRDAFDADLLRRCVLDPLAATAPAAFRARGFDLERDAPIDDVPRTAASGDVVLVEGSFLLRPELRDGFDYVVFVETSFETAERRGVARDAAGLGGEEAARRLYRVRYHAAQRLHFDEIDVDRDATAVVGNEILDRPTLRLRS
jgi:uridine kinase